MIFKTIQVSKETHEMLDICKDIFMEHHPEFERQHLSYHKIVYEAVKYYIKTEPKHKHRLVKVDKYEK